MWYTSKHSFKLYEAKSNRIKGEIYPSLSHNFEHSLHEGGKLIRKFDILIQVVVTEVYSDVKTQQALPRFV